LLVCGIPTIDLKEWRENVEGTLSDGHVKETKELAKTLDEETDKEKLGDLLGYLFSVETLLCWFWEIVSEMDTSTQTKLLAFACGTGRLPVDGFRALKPKFRVEVATSEPAENLPSSHTCFNQLVVPPYKSKADMAIKLQKAIQYGADGFGFA